MSELYTVTVVLRQPGTNVALNYRSETKARDAHKLLHGLIAGANEVADMQPVALLEDDFGNMISVDTTDAMAVVFQDCGKAMEAQVMMGLLQAHAQAKAQRRAASDPMLRPPGVLPGLGNMNG